MIGGTNMNIYIAEMVAKRRRELNMTQEELASRICISAQAVSNWERMESYPDITMLPILSSILEISVDDLLGIGRETDEQIREKWVADMQEKPEANRSFRPVQTGKDPLAVPVFHPLRQHFFRTGRQIDEPLSRVGFRIADRDNVAAAAECARYSQRTGLWIEIIPAQRAQFAESKTGRKLQVEEVIPERIAPDHFKIIRHLRFIEHLHFRAVLFRDGSPDRWIDPDQMFPPGVFHCFVERHVNSSDV
jgi:transcriptional regulator with XRE-family HTH domain